jgi:hypothetical protein
LIAVEKFSHHDVSYAKLFAHKSAAPQEPGKPSLADSTGPISAHLLLRQRLRQFRNLL